MKRTWVLEVELKVEDSWIADGFDVDEERLHLIEDQLSHLLPYAYGYEFGIKVRVKTKPFRSIIELLQEGGTK